MRDKFSVLDPTAAVNPAFCHGPHFGFHDLYTLCWIDPMTAIAEGESDIYECGNTSKQRNNDAITEDYFINELSQTECHEKNSFRGKKRAHFKIDVL
jgi:hypothetical protein